MERTVYARRGLRLAPWYGYLAFLWACVALLATGLTEALFLSGRWSLERAMVTSLLGLIVFSTFRAALGSFRWVRRLCRYSLVLDPSGLTLDVPGAEGVSVPWRDVRGVVTDTEWVTQGGFFPFRYRQENHTLRTVRGDYHFCSWEIPAARRAAREIVARIS